MNYCAPHFMVSSVEDVLFLDPLIKCYGKMRSDEDELCANLIRLSFPDHGFRFTVHYFKITLQRLYFEKRKYHSTF